MNSEQLQAQLRQAFLGEYGEHLQAMRRVLSVRPLGPGDGREALFRLHTLKGAARAAGLTLVEEIAHALEDLVADLDAGRRAWSEPALALLGKGLDAIEELSESLRHSRPAPDLRELAQAQFGQELAPAEQSVESTEETVRVPVSVLTALMREAGAVVTQTAELEHVRRLLVEAPRERELHWRWESSLHSLRRYSSELLETLRSTLTQPARELLGGLGGVVTEMAAAEGKEVRFVADGLEVEAERGLLQALLEPSLHLLRNAVHHGLESPEQRRARGLDPRGTIWLRVRQSGGQLTVEVEDDGSGLDTTRIRSRSQELGLAPGLSPQEIVLTPGFSTAEVGRIAGRGVGLAAVRATLERLSGTLELIEPERPGMRLRMRVPATLGGQPLLLVQAAGCCFGVPSHLVLTVLKVSRGQLAESGRGPGVRWEGRVVPLAFLGQLLGHPEPPAEPPWPVLVLEELALAVEGWGGFQQALVHQLEATAAVPEYLGGAFFGEDGSVGGVLSAAWLSQQRGGAGPPALVAAEAPPQRTVLVVDDSLTTRTMSTVLLQARGYRVHACADGRQALEALREYPVDLVLSDVQMPEMDGLALLQAIRSEPAWHSLPVVLLTSLNDPDSVSRGLEGGADAYLVKQEFDQQKLLETLERLL